MRDIKANHICTTQMNSKLQFNAVRQVITNENNALLFYPISVYFPLEIQIYKDNFPHLPSELEEVSFYVSCLTVHI